MSVCLQWNLSNSLQIPPGQGTHDTPQQDRHHCHRKASQASQLHGTRESQRAISSATGRYERGSWPYLLGARFATFVTKGISTNGAFGRYMPNSNRPPLHPSEDIRPCDSETFSSNLVVSSRGVICIGLTRNPLLNTSKTPVACLFDSEKPLRQLVPWGKCAEMPRYAGFTHVCVLPE